MHEETALSWLSAAERMWSGHSTALVARLAQPSVTRLTEEQEALALGIAARLVHSAAKLLPLASEAEDIWARWEATGLPASAALAPSLIARVEEYRWLRQQPQPPAPPSAPLFQPAPMAADVPVAMPAPDAEPDAVETAYLHLRVADGLRTNAIGQPLLLPHELPAAALRALLLDLAAQDLVLIGSGQGRAADMAEAIDAALTGPVPDAIDAAARRYHAALFAVDILADATTGAVQRRDWLAVVALLGAQSGAGFSHTAAALLASGDAQIVAALSGIGVAAAAAGPLLDALADVPGRPDPASVPALADPGKDTMAAVAARTATLRADIGSADKGRGDGA